VTSEDGIFIIVEDGDLLLSRTLDECLLTALLTLVALIKPCGWVSMLERSRIYN
jgi:hypothetical protein